MKKLTYSRKYEDCDISEICKDVFEVVESGLTVDDYPTSDDEWFNLFTEYCDILDIK